MPADALYVYGIVKFGFDLEWKEIGLNKENVYIIGKKKFSALVHNCEEKPYIDKDPNKIKDLIISHNIVLNKAMKDFDGVIPLPFNTIIKKTEKSARHNLKKWLNNNKDMIEKNWNKIKGKKEYGIRIYCEKDNLTQEASKNEEIKKIEKSLEKKSKGLSYLLHEKIKSKTNELIQNKINQFKQKFYDDIKKLTEDSVVNVSRISLDEDKNLLVSLSILVDKQQKIKLQKFLKTRADKTFSFNLAGPFAPYSFVENEISK